MLLTFGNGTTRVQRCIYCAFQVQKHALQVRRLKTVARKAAVEAHPSAKDKVSDHGVARSQDRARKIHPGTWPSSLPLARGKFNADRRSGGFGIPRSTGRNFDAKLTQTLQSVREEYSNAPFIQRLAEERQEAVHTTFAREWQKFVAGLKGYETPTQPFVDDSSSKPRKPKPTRLYADLKEAWEAGGSRGLKSRFKYSFCDMAIGDRFSPENIKTQKALADIRYPTEWYPATRPLQRVFHLHVGPTNSGKTYQALKRLEEATGLSAYAGPLRLLAHEVYTRLNAKGIVTMLTTGDDRRVPDNVTSENEWRVNACTVEMLPLNTTMEVCVIDEIQMLGDEDRGWAWTQAILAVKARELHLCGEERAVPLVKQICALTGEKLHIHRYERLSPLQMAEKSLGGDLRQLEKGDCIVSFSVMGIHALRKIIERNTGRKVATVYGSLPSETRAQQAKLFNDPDNDYDFLVASDAVGMGLNLAIKRVIFETTLRFNGSQHVPLDIASIKQIAGRAGRYRTAAQANKQAAVEQALSAAKSEPVLATEAPVESPPGLVTTLEDVDFPIVKAAMESQPPPLRTAGIAPPMMVVEKFTNYFPPDTPFSYIVTKLRELCSVSKRFHLCNIQDQTIVMDMIEPVRNLSTADRYVFSQAPVFRDSRNTMESLMPAYARILADQTGGNLVEIRELPLEILDAPLTANRDYLQQLESLHKSVVLYLWLSYQFAGAFRSRDLAFHVKELTEAKIELVLGEMSFASRSKIVKARKERQRVEQMAIAAVHQGTDKGLDPADNVALALATDEDGLGLDEPSEGPVDSVSLPDGMDDTDVDGSVHTGNTRGHHSGVRDPTGGSVGARARGDTNNEVIDTVKDQASSSG